MQQFIDDLAQYVSLIMVLLVGLLFLLCMILGAALSLPRLKYFKRFWQGEFRETEKVKSYVEMNEQVFEFEYEIKKPKIRFWRLRDRLFPIVFRPPHINDITEFVRTTHPTVSGNISDKAWELWGEINENTIDIESREQIALSQGEAIKLRKRIPFSGSALKAERLTTGHTREQQTDELLERFEIVPYPDFEFNESIEGPVEIPWNDEFDIVDVLVIRNNLHLEAELVFSSQYETSYYARKYIQERPITKSQSNLREPVHTLSFKRIKYIRGERIEVQVTKRPNLKAGSPSAATENDSKETTNGSNGSGEPVDSNV